MAVLPPVIVPCDLPDPAITTTDPEPDLALVSQDTAAECAAPGEFDPCTNLVLSVGTVTNVIPLSWILYNAPATPDSYNLYRRTIGLEKSLTLYQAGITDNTYDDSGFISGRTHEYLVRPVYAGVESISSNIVSAGFFGLQYVYAYQGTDLKIINILDPLAPFLAATIAGIFPSLTVSLMVHDGRFIYLQITGPVTNRVFILDMFNPLVPVVVFDHEFGRGVQTGQMLIRRNVATRNNLMFVTDSSDQIQSWNISNPINPVLVSTIAAPISAPNGQGFAYNTVDDKLYFGVISGADGGPGFTAYCSIPVADDGTLSAGSSVTLHPTAAYLFQGTAARHNHIWGLWFNPDVDGVYYGYPIPGTVADAALGIAGGGWKGILPGRWRSDDVIILPRFNVIGNAPPIRIISCPVGGSGVLHSTIGTNGTATKSVAIFGDYLYLCIGSNFFIYNISDPDVPVLVYGPLALGGTLGALCVYPDDAWYGNNGLCAA